MINKDLQPISERLHPVMSAFLFLLVALIAFIALGPFVGTVLVALSYEGDLMDLMTKIQDPFNDPGFKKYLFLLQGAATGIGLILTPWLYIKFVNRKKLSFLSTNHSLSLVPFVSVFLIVAAFMVVNSFFIEWNSKMQLPEFMGGMEEWMRQTEDQAARLTEYMTTFGSRNEFWVAMLVIAVLPAIGEELVFRGYVQRELMAGIKNPHMAIWISAILFSAIHLQFFGFIPRVLLGALFGYLFYWSGNIWYPIIAHFVQNGGQLLLLYMVQQGVTDIDVDSPESFPLPLIILFSFITLALLIIFRKSFVRRADEY